MIKDIVIRIDGYNIKINGIISKIIVKWHIMKHYHIALMIKESL